MMPAGWRLAISHWRYRPLRPLLTAIVTMAGVALVFAGGAGLNSGKASLEGGLTAMLGSADLRVEPAVQRAGFAAAEGGFLPAGMLRRVRAIPQVRMAAARQSGHVLLQVAGAENLVRAVGISPKLDGDFHPMTFVAGQCLRGPDDIIVDSRLASRFKLHAGEQAAIAIHPGKFVKLRVCGIVTETPVQRFLKPPTCYLDRHVLTKVCVGPGGVTSIDIKLRAGLASKQWAVTIGKSLGPAAHVAIAGTARAAFKKIGGVFNRVLLLGALLSGLCGAVLICGIMAVGLQERVRHFGHLRCLGASRGQLAQMVLVEALLAGVIGTAAGMLVGWVGSWLLVRHYASVLGVYRVGHVIPVAAVMTGLLATAFGALLPMWLAVRVQPLRAVASVAQASSIKRVILVALVGVLLITLQVVLWQVPSPVWRFRLYALVGNPAVFIGVALIAPLVVVLLERPAAWGLAFIWGLRRELLSGAWSRSPWRMGAMVASLLVGITFFISVESRAAGLLQSWEFPAGLPDVYVFSPFAPLPSNRLKTLPRAVPGIKDSTAITAFFVKAKPSGGRQRNMLFVVIQPKSFERMISLQFRQGDEKQAFAALMKGRAVIVASQAQHAVGLSTGSRIIIDSPVGAVPFKIAGVANSPGLNILKNYFGSSRLFGQVARMSLVGTAADARRYFGITGFNTVMISLKPGTRGMPVMEAAKKYMSERPASFLGSLFAAGTGGLHGTSIKQMKRNLDHLVRRVLGALSLIAMVVLVVASVGVAAMMGASVRHRRYEFGVLRACGAGRGQLVRLVLAETSLAALVACGLGVVQGLYFAWMATNIDRLLAGFASEFVINWQGLVFPVVLTLALALGTALWPAARASVVAGRALLASGRC